MTELFVERRGTGSPVLFLHGIGASSRYWESVQAVASGRFALVAPDLLGFGRSPKPDDQTYDVDCHLSLIEPLVAPESLVVGHSTGAILAAALAARRPDLASCLLLFGLPAYPTREAAAHDIEALGWLSKETVEATLTARAISWTEEHLERVSSEVRLVHGRSDADAPVAYVRDLARELRPKVTLRVVRGDHHLALRRPRLVANAVAHALHASPRSHEAQHSSGGT